MNTADLEVVLRIAISDIQAAQNRLATVSGGDDLAEADELLGEATAWVRKWAEKNDVALKDRMRT